MSTVTPLGGRGSVAYTIIPEIRAWMGRRSVNQTQLAQHLGLSQSQLSKRLRGTITIDVDELEAIAAFLDVDPVVLLKPSVTPWPDGPDDDPGGQQSTRAIEIERAARRHRGTRDQGVDTHRYVAA